MSHKSYARDALRSFLPADTLIQQRDANSLYYKCEAQGTTLLGNDRARVLFNPAQWIKPPRRSLERYEPTKYIGGLIVQSNEPSLISAHDPDNPGACIKIYDSRLVQLHVDSFEGPTQIRQDCIKAAGYLAMHPEVSKLPNIITATYKPLATLASRVAGFRPMRCTDVLPNYELELAARQATFNVMNGRTDGLEVCALYMPVSEFVERFNGESASVKMNL